MFGAGSFRRRRRQDRPDPGLHRTGLKWFNDGVWKDHFIPNPNQVHERPAGQGQPVPVGQPRDGPRSTRWYTCCMNPARAGQGHRLTTSAGPSPRRTTARRPPSCMPTRSACSRPPRTRTQAFTALTALVASARAADHLRRLAGRSGPAAGASFDVDQRGTTRTASSTGTSRRRCSATPTSPTTRPGCRTTQKSKAAWQAVPVQVPHHRGARHRQRAGTLKTTLQGIFDERGQESVAESSSSDLPGGSRRPGGRSPHPPGARPADERDDRGAAARVHDRAARSVLRPAVPRGDLGLPLHRPVADRPRAVHRGPDDRLVRPCR